VSASSNPNLTDEQRDIAADIEATRERLGETVEELAHRLDVKAQVQNKVDETKDAVHAKVDETKETVQNVVLGAKESVLAQAESLKVVAVGAAQRRDVQIAAGVAALSGVAGALLLRK